MANTTHEKNNTMVSNTSNPTITTSYVSLSRSGKSWAMITELSEFLELAPNKDYKQVVEWYREAAKQGDAVAQNALGFCYSKGKGVPQDYKLAIEWYRKAADQGHAVAQRNLKKTYKYLEKRYKHVVADTNTSLSLEELYNNYELPIPKLDRCVACTPPQDPRGVMTCDCEKGDNCCVEEHQRTRWTFVISNSNNHDSSCTCHDCICCNEYGCDC
jgi:hypothetical protein